jgi:prephenate dehydratase
MLLQTQARALVAASAKRVDPENCASTAEPVRAWLDAADQAVSIADSLSVALPDLPVVKRRIRNQRARVSELCPG